MVALSVFAGALVWSATDPYPGVTVDSGEYLAVAEGLLDGEGFTMPYLNYDERYRVLEPAERVAMTQFPPLYPMLLASIQNASGLVQLDVVRALGSFLYAASVLLVQGIVWRHTRNEVMAVIAGVAMFVTGVFTGYAMSWTEPLMIVAMLGALAFFMRYVESGRVGQLWAVAVYGAAASTARYAGIAVPVAVALLLALQARRRKVSWSRPALFLGAALVPVVVWFVRNAIVAGSASEKGLGFYPPGTRHLVQAVQTIGSWIAPGPALASALGVGLIVGAAFLLRRHPPKPTDPFTLPFVCLVFGASYVAFVLASRILLDQNIPLDPRILAPLQVLTIVGVSAVVAKSGRRSWKLALAGLALFGLLRGLDTARQFDELTVTGYTNETWRASPVLAAAGELPGGTMIVTNAPDPIWLWHDRVSQLIPPRSSLYSGKPNANYSAQLEEIRAATACREARVVFFSRPTRKPARTIDPLIVYELGLTETQTFEDGTIYDIDEPVCEEGAEISV